MNEKIKIINLGIVNAFLVRIKDGFVLIDTGLHQSWEKLENELTSAGCSSDTLKLVLITHGDWDHIGNCAKLQEKYKVKIAMHQADANMAENGVMLKRKIRTLSRKIMFLCIMILRKIQKRKMSFEKFKPDMFVVDGQSLAEYGFNAKIIHIPGHTKGSIGILTDDGDLFAGDTFNNTKKPDTAIIIENAQELENSINKLKKMNIKMIYPGHGKPFPMDSILKIKNW